MSDTIPTPDQRHSRWCVAATICPPAAAVLAAYDAAGSLGLLPYGHFLEATSLPATVAAAIALNCLILPVGCSLPICAGWGRLGRRLYANSRWLDQHPGVFDVVAALLLVLVGLLVATSMISRAVIDVGTVCAVAVAGLPGYTTRQRRAAEHLGARWRF